ncbi:deacylase [Endozoicomonas sp. OPT23]|uniref:aminoacyl-tRNA deacylase n=1 Tax=Endozoicomonas sp. OPT23 TaxID=2072845 RepID=UPI00129AE605|nr:YbaK/EbsC family protein [Endozoicomonas sp. OPT23]MRI34994.1 deacylase [Endozoicomonas sp. OPT23]
MADQKVVDYLEQHHVSYSSCKHEPAFTAQEIAEKAHISGRSMAKTVVVKLDGRLALCILPAAERVNFSQLRHIAGSHTAELASEDEFIDRFKHCEPGSLPPFGELFNLPVYAVGSLGSQPSVAVSSGDSSELLLLAWQDFEGLVKPVVLMEQQKSAIA